MVFKLLQLCLVGILFCASSLAAAAAEPQPVSSSGAASGTDSVSAGGDSSNPILSPDGRYVLFVSTANNLASGTSGQTFLPQIPPKLNIYRRDRQLAVTTLASSSTNGSGANDDCFPLAISPNGQYALFESAANNLVAGDTNNASDIFLRDLVSAVTHLVSVSTNGNPANGRSYDATMTPDGRFVAFVSDANNIVPGDTNRIPDVFARDLSNAVTILVSHGAQSTNFNLAAGFSGIPSISDDGRYVAFLSTATNLVPGVTLHAHVYVRDLLANTTHWASTNARALVGAAHVTSNAFCFDPRISADGSSVLFVATPNPEYYPTGIVARFTFLTGTSQTVATNAAVPWAMREEMRSLSATPDHASVAFVARTNALFSGVFGVGIRVWNASSNSIILASGNTNGIITRGSFCDWPAISADGRYVAFLSSATGMVSNPTIGAWHLYRRDLQSNVTKLVNANTNNVGVPVSSFAAPKISADGRYIAFESVADSLVAGDGNQKADVFVRDMLYGTNELISVHQPGSASTFGNGISALKPGALSQDGRLVAFRSSANNLAGSDTNGWNDIFVRDRSNHATSLISVSTNGVSGSGPSLEPVITPSGRHVAFASHADDLVPGDTNRTCDVFVRDLDLGLTTAISRTTNGVFGRHGSFSPILSPDGRFTVFQSKSLNLVPGLSGEYENYFLHDAQSGSLRALTSNGGFDASFSGDGKWLAVYGVVSGSALVIWDLTSLQPISTNATGSPGKVCLSHDGSKVAWIAGSQLQLLDRIQNTNWTVAIATNSLRTELNFSHDGRSLIFLSHVGLVPQDTNSQVDVYVYDVPSRSFDLISRNLTGTNSPNGPSEMPDLSSDGRWVAFVSSASNIVPGDVNEQPDLFIFDRQTRSTTLVSILPLGSGMTHRRCAWPQFSPDRQTLVFQSWAADLATGDYNNQGDIFALPWFVIALLFDESGPVIQWPSFAGYNFTVQVNFGLNPGQWQDLAGPITNAGHKMLFKDSSASAPKKFYRVVAY